MSLPTDRLYAETHEWHKIDGDTLTLGLTRFAVDQLTDVTYVQMKPVGTKLQPGDIVGEVESVKTTSDIYTGLAGEIAEVNTALADDPSIVNSDPYEAGWLVKIKIADKSGADKLLDAKAYEAAHP